MKSAPELCGIFPFFFFVLTFWRWLIGRPCSLGLKDAKWKRPPCLSCGARLWKTCCRLGPRFRNLKERKRGKKRETALSVTHQLQSSRWGEAAAALVRLQWWLSNLRAASVSTPPTDGVCVCGFICVCVCGFAYMLVWALIYNSFTLLSSHSTSKSLLLLCSSLEIKVLKVSK